MGEDNSQYTRQESTFQCLRLWARFQHRCASRQQEACSVALNLFPHGKYARYHSFMQFEAEQQDFSKPYLPDQTNLW